MRRPAAALAAIAALVTGLPAHAGPEDRLPHAEQRLEDTATRLEQARATYEATAERLAGLRSELATIQDRMDRHRRAARAARRRWRRLDHRTEQAAHELSARRRALSRQVAATYRRGTTDAEKLWLSMAASAAGPHEMALADKLSDRLLARDQHLLAAARAERRATARARRRARRAARQAEARRQQVAGLVARQRALVDEVRTQQQAQQAVVDELAADHEAQAVLVETLRRQLGDVQAVLTTPRRVPFDQPDPPWADRLPGAGQAWAAEIDAAAARAGIDGRFLAALVWTESYFRQEAVSPAGAIGLTQLMPATAEALGVDPHDPRENLQGGARYVRRQLEDFRDLKLGLAAYNRGPAEVEEEGMPDSVAVRLYVLTVIERWRDLVR